MGSFAFMSPSERAARVGLLQICVAGVLWGTGGLAVQVIRRHVAMSPLTISAWRMGLAAAVLLVALVATGQVSGVRTLLRTRPAYAVAVGLATASYQALYFSAVIEVGVTVSTVVSLGLAPLLLTVGEAAVARRRPATPALVVLGLALTGLVLVSSSAGLHATGPRPALGLLMSAGSGTAYAVTTVFGRRVAQVTSPLALTTTTTSIGALGLLPFGLLSAGPRTTADPVAMATLLYLGIMPMALAYGLLYAGLRTTRGSAAVVATLLEPVTAAAAAAAVLGERVGLLGLVGGTLILAAVGGLAIRPAVPPN